MSKRTNWKPIEEMDTEDGQHTCYATIDKYGYRVWLTQISNNTWDVEMSYPGSDYISTLANCKTLTSAKRWSARYLHLV